MTDRTLPGSAARVQRRVKRNELDSSALIAHHRQEAGREQVQAIFDDNDAIVIVASVTLTEFARRLRELGAHEVESCQILEDYQTLFSDMVPVDTAVAMVAFEIGCRATQRLPLVDALIAAAAQSRQPASCIAIAA